MRFIWTYFNESMLFDLRNGTNTSVRVAKEDQSIDAEEKTQSDGLLYVASFTSVVRNSVSAVRYHAGQDSFRLAQFVDLGCGKGKAILQYALHERSQESPPAIGIEYDSTLAGLARRNLERCRISPDVAEIYTASALDIRAFLSADEFILYLYNSFQGETLRNFLHEVSALPHYLIYVDPVERDMIVDEFGYAVIEDNTGAYNASTWLLAESPASSS